MYAELNACMRKLLGCKYADFGCMSIKHLGACMRKCLGAKYADVGCKSMELGACLTVLALPDSGPLLA